MISRCAPGWQLEQWLERRRLCLEPEQRALEPEQQHRLSLLPPEKPIPYVPEPPSLRGCQITIECRIIQHLVFVI